MTFLSIITQRNPTQKLHSSLGYAKLAFDQHPGSAYRGRHGKIYQHIDGEWALLYDIPEQSFTTDTYVVKYRAGDVTRTRRIYNETRPWKLGQQPLNVRSEE